MRDEMTAASGSTTTRLSPATWTAPSRRCAPASPASPVWDGTTAQLLALVASFAITALTFNATAA